MKSHAYLYSTLSTRVAATPGASVLDLIGTRNRSSSLPLTLLMRRHTSARVIIIGMTAETLHRYGLQLMKPWRKWLWRVHWWRPAWIKGSQRWERRWILPVHHAFGAVHATIGRVDTWFSKGLGCRHRRRAVNKLQRLIPLATVLMAKSIKPDRCYYAPTMTKVGRNTEGPIWSGAADDPGRGLQVGNWREPFPSQLDVRQSVAAASQQAFAEAAVAWAVGATSCCRGACESKRKVSDTTGRETS